MLPPPRDYARRLPPPSEIALSPIGVVRSPHLERHGTPRQAHLHAHPDHRDVEQSTIELFDHVHPTRSLRDLDGFDYVWVLALLHLNEGWNPTVIPPRGERRRRGLFATRAPHRPCPIGLSAARLVEVTERAIVVERIDLLDGTPVLDLKPYLPSADAFPDARAGWVDALSEDGLR